MLLSLINKSSCGIALAIVAAGTGGLIASAAQANGLAHRFGAAAQAAKSESRANMPTGRQSMSTLPAISGIATRITPTVVHLSVSGSKNVSIAADTSCDDDIDLDESPDAMALKKRLKQFQKQFGILPPMLKVPVQSDGSGVIIGEDGIIMTNAHVVEMAEAISVKLHDRREYQARLLGTDPLTDIALIKIDAKGLPVAKLAQDSRLAPGDWVVAIGSPFGLSHSVTAGVVSATERFFSSEDFLPFIQSDAAVNPGSSGGPLVNMRGEVVGINSGFMTRTTGFQGLSFAIPIDLARKVSQALLRDGRVRHAQLGIEVQDLSDPLAKSFNLHKPAGALVIDVSSDSTAQKAGLEIGDVILSVDGREINVSGEIATSLIMASPGQAMALDVWHRGAMRKVRVLLDEAPEKADKGGMLLSAAQQDIASLGLVISALDPDDQLGVNKGTGVLVRSVTGAAQHAGVRMGDILLALNATPIKNLDDAVKIAAGAGDYMAALIQHGQEKRYVALYRGK